MSWLDLFSRECVARIPKTTNFTKTIMKWLKGKNNSTKQKFGWLEHLYSRGIQVW